VNEWQLSSPELHESRKNDARAKEKEKEKGKRKRKRKRKKKQTENEMENRGSKSTIFLE